MFWTSTDSCSGTSRKTSQFTLWKMIFVCAECVVWRCFLRIVLTAIIILEFFFFFFFFFFFSSRCVRYSMSIFFVVLFFLSLSFIQCEIRYMTLRKVKRIKCRNHLEIFLYFEQIHSAVKCNKLPDFLYVKIIRTCPHSERRTYLMPFTDWMSHFVIGSVGDGRITINECDNCWSGWVRLSFPFNKQMTVVTSCRFHTSCSPVMSKENKLASSMIVQTKNTYRVDFYHRHSTENATDSITIERYCSYSLKEQNHLLHSRSSTECLK
jgi:hypothetical protein